MSKIDAKSRSTSKLSAKHPKVPAANVSTANDLPLSGLKVVEFSQMVMGPCCGLILADLGADVIKVEPVGKGDRTRYLPERAAGFFTAFNRNKQSIAIDMKSPKGMAISKQLIAEADVMIENFRPGMMADMGLGYESLAPLNPRLIYCTLKGFLPGPYDKRAALDEVVQMMGGLAYMTGPVGKPMRAGASVNDIMGAMFGVIGIQSALRERERTGKGQEIQASLYENNVFLMMQAMLAEAVTGEQSPPWSVETRPWPVYDLFETKDGKQLFVGIVGDGQWKTFCEAFAKTEWLSDPGLQNNADRSRSRDRLLPDVTAIVKRHTLAEMEAMLEKLGLPFAPVRVPGDLSTDHHLLASGGLVDVNLPKGGTAKAPLLPLILGGRRPGLRSGVPAVGAHTVSVLRHLGYSTSDIDQFEAEKITSSVTTNIPEE